MDKRKLTITLYPDKSPRSERWMQQETENANNMWNTRIIYNVDNPTITVFQPASSVANSTALIICPGGRFHALSMDSEGLM